MKKTLLLSVVASLLMFSASATFAQSEHFKYKWTLKQNDQLIDSGSFTTTLETSRTTFHGSPRDSSGEKAYHSGYDYINHNERTEDTGYIPAPFTWLLSRIHIIKREYTTETVKSGYDYILISLIICSMDFVLEKIEKVCPRLGSLCNHFKSSTITRQLALEQTSPNDVPEGVIFHSQHLLYEGQSNENISTDVPIFDPLARNNFTQNLLLQWLLRSTGYTKTSIYIPGFQHQPLNAIINHFMSPYDLSHSLEIQITLPDNETLTMTYNIVQFETGITVKIITISHNGYTIEITPNNPTPPQTQEVTYCDCNGACGCASHYDKNSFNSHFP